MLLLRRKQSMRGSRRKGSGRVQRIMAWHKRWPDGLTLERGNLATPDLVDRLQQWQEEMFRQAGQTVEGMARRGAMARLDQIMVECGNPGWDGEGASPVTKQARAEALRFLLLLPLSFPTPEVDPEPDGGVALEWCLRRHCVFTLYFSGTQVVGYTGIFGGRDVTRYGTEPFVDEVPAQVLRNLQELYATE